MCGTDLPLPALVDLTCGVKPLRWPPPLIVRPEEAFLENAGLEFISLRHEERDAR